MKIRKFNENVSISAKIEKQYNETRYVVRKFSPNEYEVAVIPCFDIETAISTYDKYNDDNMIIIVEEKCRILTTEEIDLLRSTNKYNL